MQIAIDVGSIITHQKKIDECKQTKIAQLSEQCRLAIVSNFESDALGAIHTYPQKETDQLNLAGSVLSSTLDSVDADWVTPFWCADADGVWEMRNHTAQQIQQIGMESKARILSNMQKNATLAAQVMAATSIQEVESVVW